MADKPKKKWIKSAIKHPNAERNAAKRAGMSTHSFMEKNKDAPGTAGKRARLGLTLEGMHHKRKKTMSKMYGSAAKKG